MQVRVHGVPAKSWQPSDGSTEKRARGQWSKMFTGNNGCRPDVSPSLVSCIHTCVLHRFSFPCQLLTDLQEPPGTVGSAVLNKGARVWVGL